MNKIIEVAVGLNGERTPKSFEVIVFSENGEINGKTVLKGQTAVIPPLKKYSASDGLRISFDGALLPFTEITVIDGCKAAIAFAVCEAQTYINSDLPKKEFLLSAISNFILSYLIVFAEKKDFSPAVETVRSEILKGVSDCTFSLEDCLKRLPLNYDYIRKAFKKETGTTPHDFLLKERMSLASQLLSSGISNKFSSYSISQVAEACGYSEPLYFSRVFKKYFGVSPSGYKLELS